MRKVLLVVLGLVSVGAIVFTIFAFTTGTVKIDIQIGNAPTAPSSPTHTYTSAEVIGMLKDRLSKRNIETHRAATINGFTGTVMWPAEVNIDNCLDIVGGSGLTARKMNGIPARWAVEGRRSGYKYVFYERTRTFEMTQGEIKAC